MKNIFLGACSKESYLFAPFCRAISDAIFKCNPDDRRELHASLRARGLSDQAIKGLRRSYMRSRCRHTVPEPKVLAEHLWAVHDLFGGLHDPKTGAHFFNSTARRRFENAVAYCNKGLVSDVPGLCYYQEKRTTAQGIKVYRCLRSSSALEGYHQVSFYCRSY